MTAVRDNGSMGPLGALITRVNLIVQRWVMAWRRPESGWGHPVPQSLTAVGFSFGVSAETRHEIALGAGAIYDCRAAIVLLRRNRNEKEDNAPPRGDGDT